jgi:hypothetical protein
MTSISDIPYADIEIFLLSNNKRKPRNKEEGYKLAFTLIKDPNAKGHTRNIAEWMKAYNLIQNAVNVPTYNTLNINNMDEEEIDALARLLTMKSNNINTIKNILRYLHKLDERTILNTGVADIDYQFLQNFDTKILGQMEITEQYRRVLNDQKFWKNRLNNKLKLFVTDDDKNFDYKFAVKFLDNGKSIEENYKEAMDKGLHIIIKLLIDNNVVAEIKPPELLSVDNLLLTIPELGDINKLPYDKFIDKLRSDNNAKINDINKNDFTGLIGNYDPMDLLPKSYFDKIEYTGKEITIYPSFNDDEEGEPPNDLVIKTDGGISNGELLYQIAKLVPSEDTIEQKWINDIREHTEEILEQIERDKESYLKRHPKEFLDVQTNLSEKFLRNLIKTPNKFIEFANKNHKYTFLPYYDYFGSHIYFEGLSYNNNVYRVAVGS